MDNKYFVYILKSEKSGRHYIGQTQSLEKRLVRHNQGLVTATKKDVPWYCLYHEIYSSRSEAYKREMEIKSYKGGIQFKKMIEKERDKQSAAC